VQGHARTTLDGAHRGVGVREIHIRERHAGTGHHDLRTRVGAEDLRQSGAPVEALRTTRSAKG
jgi:hypothetical protein